MSAQIRPYQQSDLNGILNAWESASNLAHPFLPKDFQQQEKYNIEHLYLPNTVTWVVENDGNVVGFISLIGNEVGGLFVDPKWHGSGLGKALMDQAAQCHPVLEVEVFQQNNIGRAFYEKYGFKPLEEKVHPPTGNKLLRLRYNVDQQDA